MNKDTEIYSPEEDSYLLSETLEKEIKGLRNKDKIKFLDVGSGSGIQSETALNCGINQKNITLTDINNDAIKLLQNKFPKSKVIKSNLFAKISKNKTFDLIVFNPPYLPEDKREPLDSKVSTTGGKKGSEIINEFLRRAKNHLNENGEILILTSSLTKDINWQKGSYEYKKLLSKRKLFFEELYVWKLKVLRTK